MVVCVGRFGLVVLLGDFRFLIFVLLHFLAIVFGLVWVF